MGCLSGYLPPSMDSVALVVVANAVAFILAAVIAVVVAVIFCNNGNNGNIIGFPTPFRF